MIDTAFVEQRMRDVNPIPGVDNINPEELSRAVAVVTTARAATKQTPTQHQITPSPPAPTPLRRSRRAWAFAAAFILILAAIGITAIALRNNNSPVTYQLAPPAVLADFSDGWEQVATDEAWVHSILDVDALPGGGFLAAAIEPWRLMWSPDGTEWFDADPERELGDPTGSFVVAGSRALILTQTPPGVWLGDPRAGVWERIPLDTIGLDLSPRLLAVGASETRALVVAETRPRIETREETIPIELTTWLIDLATGTSERHRLPTPAHQLPCASCMPGDEVAVEWFNGRWLVVPSCRSCSTIYLSTDGSKWTESEIRWTADQAPLPEWSEDFRPGDRWGTAWLDAATGPDAILAAFFARPHAYSEDGITWSAMPFPSVEGAEWSGEWFALTYSDELGFVAGLASPEWGRFLQMENGPTWRDAGRWPDSPGAVHHLAASGDQVLLVHEDIQTGVPGVKNLWLWAYTEEGVP